MARMKAVILSSCLLVVTLTLVSARPVRNARGLNSGSNERYSRYFRSLYPSYYPYTPYFRPPYYKGFPGSNYPRFNFPGFNFPGFNYPGYGRVPIFNGYERNGNPGAAREEENVEAEGSPREYSLINVDSQSSEISREDTSSEEDEDYSVSFGNGVPDYQHPGVPDYQHPGVPDYQHPGVPDYQHPGVPDYQHPGMPDYQHPGMPDYQHPGVPDYQHPGVPDYQHPGVPDYQHPGVPDYQHPTVPDYVHPRVPDYGHPRVPDYGHPRVPDYVHPRVPDYEEAVTPEEEFPVEPDYEGPLIPGMDTAIDVGLELQSSKGAEDGTSNADDPTSGLPYSDSSQSTDSHGLNLEEDQIFTGSNQTAGLHEEVNGPDGLDSNPEQTLSNEGFVDLPRTVKYSATEDQSAEDPRNTDLATFTTEDGSNSEDQGRDEDQYRFPEDHQYEDDDDLSDYIDEGNDETESEFSRAGSKRSSSSESDEMGLDAGVVEVDDDHDEDSSEDVTNKSQAEDDWPRGDEDVDANYSL